MLGLESVLASSDIGTFTESARCDLLVVDHYGLDWVSESSFRGQVRRVLVIDDLANRGHDCDVLVDQTLGRSRDDYIPLVPESATILTGSRYALLRPGFAELRTSGLSRRRDRVRRVFVSLGGSSAQHLSAALAGSAAEAFPDAEVVVAMSAGALGAADVQRLASSSGNRVTLQTDADMAREMTAADLAIGGSGTTAWERCCLGLPSLMVVLADNQAGIAAALEHAGAARRIASDVDSTEMRRVVASLDLAAMSAAAARACDGEGVSRVLEAVEATLGGSVLLIRPAGPGDSRFVWETNSDPDVRRVSQVTAAIPWEDHMAWFDRRLEDPDYRMYIVETAGAPCGIVRFRREGEVATISIALRPSCRGRGLGTEAIRSASRLARRSWPIVSVEATIHRSNGQSIQAFRRAGFVERPDEGPEFLRLAEKWPPFRAERRLMTTDAAEGEVR